MNVSDFSTISEFAAEKRGRVIDLLKDLIGYRSVHGEEYEAQEFLAARFGDLGYEVQMVPISEKIREDPEYTNPESPIPYEGRPNLALTHGGGGDGRGLILNTHVDVVPVGSWSAGFSPKLEGDTLVGRGAVDCKGQIACLYLLLLMLREFDLEPSGPLTCQIVIEEEIGGNGTLSLLRDGYRADGAVVLEGTDLTVCPANRGALWFRAQVRGRSIHMARKFEGVSAVDKAMDLIRILYEYEGELAQKSRGQPLFSEYPHPVQVNIGVLKAGDWPATVPDLCVMEGGVGFLPNRNLEDIREDLVDLPSRGDSWLEENTTIEFNRLHNDAYETPADHPLVTEMEKSARWADIDTRIRGMIASCDARLFNKVGGMPTLVFGAGDIDQAHSAGESVEIQNILNCSCALFDLVGRWCGFS